MSDAEWAKRFDELVAEDFAERGEVAVCADILWNGRGRYARHIADQVDRENV